jgi:putative PEP-CTERM system TPR-repeat lipoprotein
MIRHRDYAASMLVLALGVAACRHDPAADARYFEARADGYAANRQWKEAVLEYGNAIKAQPRADLYDKRARAYAEIGDVRGAFAGYARAAELAPRNVHAHLGAGRLLLAAGDFEAAESRAASALDADAQNAEAYILRAQARAGRGQLPPAIEAINAAIALAPQSSAARIALAAIQFRAGARDKAQAALDEALALDPDSVDARLARAEFRRAVDDLAGAERDLRDGLARHPEDKALHAALARLAILTDRLDEAEPHVRALADDDAGRLQLADFYLQRRRYADAAAILDPLAKSSVAATATTAQLRLAGASAAQGRTSEAYQRLDRLIAEHPHRIEARIAKARLLLQDGNARAAAAEARNALQRDSNSPDAHYVAALAAVKNGDTADAEREFEAVTKIERGATDAYLQVARLRLARNDASGALVAARDAAAAAPDNPAAALLVARGLRARGDLAEAREFVVDRLRKTPADPALSTELGWIELAGHRLHEAGRAFEDALTRQPSAIEALDGLTAVDLSSGHADAARARINARLARAPGDAHLRLLSAQLDLASGRADQARRTLEALVTSAPNELEAYPLLASIYARLGMTVDAIHAYETLATRSPHPAAALTMVGLLQQTRGDEGKARASYERALADNPDSGTAANNLAWMYAESGRLDEALRLATTADRLLARRPEPKDTLGWVLYKQQQYWQAAKAFEQAAAAAPNRAVYHYHLGLAHLRDGRRPDARRAFSRAIEAGLTGADAQFAKDVVDGREPANVP